MRLVQLRGEDDEKKPVSRPSSIGYGSEPLLPEQKKLMQELLQVPRGVLIKLARHLPFDAGAMDALLPRQYKWTQSEFHLWLNYRQALAEQYPDYPGYVVAQYCAAASQYAIAKLMEELTEVSRQKLAVVQRMRDLRGLALSNQLPELAVALRRDPGADVSHE